MTHVATLPSVFLLTFLCVLSCKPDSSEKQAGKIEVEPKPAPPEVAETPEPTTKEPAPAPAQMPSPTEFDAFGKLVLSALADKDAAPLFALAMSSKDLAPLLEATRKACPDRVPEDIDVEAATKEMEMMLGSDADRKEIYQGYHGECRKAADFSKATFKSVIATSAKLECGAGGADSLVIEALIDGKPMYVFVDDPVKTVSGWKTPETISCSAEHP